MIPTEWCCWRCIKELPPTSLPEWGVGMILCLTCGHKRCPKANDHDNECSGLNEPGQKGSAYE